MAGPIPTLTWVWPLPTTGCSGPPIHQQAPSYPTAVPVGWLISTQAPHLGLQAVNRVPGSNVHGTEVWSTKSQVAGHLGNTDNPQRVALGIGYPNPSRAGQYTLPSVSTFMRCPPSCRQEHPALPRPSRRKPVVAQGTIRSHVKPSNARFLVSPPIV